MLARARVAVQASSLANRKEAGQRGRDLIYCAAAEAKVSRCGGSGSAGASGACPVCAFSWLALGSLPPLQVSARAFGCEMELEESGIREECGVFGCIASGEWPTQLDVPHVITLGLVGLQHR